MISQYTDYVLLRAVRGGARVGADVVCAPSPGSCVMTCVRQHSVTHSSSITLKALRAPEFIPASRGPPTGPGLSHAAGAAGHAGSSESQTGFLIVRVNFRPTQSNTACPS